MVEVLSHLGFARGWGLAGRAPDDRRPRIPTRYKLYEGTEEEISLDEVGRV
jgi:hypothetical protein